MTDTEKQLLDCLHQFHDKRTWVRDTRIKNAYSAGFLIGQKRFIVSICIGTVSSESSFGVFSFVEEGLPCVMVILRDEGGDILNEIRLVSGERDYNELLETYHKIRTKVEKVDVIMESIIEDMSHGE